MKTTIGRLRQIIKEAADTTEDGEMTLQDMQQQYPEETKGLADRMRELYAQVIAGDIDGGAGSEDDEPESVTIPAYFVSKLGHEPQTDTDFLAPFDGYYLEEDNDWLSAHMTPEWMEAWHDTGHGGYHWSTPVGRPDAWEM